MKEESVDKVQPCCDGGECCPSGTGRTQRWKTVIFVLIVIGAGAVLANSLMRKSETQKPAQGFATVPLASDSPASSPAGDAVAEDNPESAADRQNAASLWRKELDALASLNQVATHADAVFVLLAAPDQEGGNTVAGQIEAAAQKIQTKGTQVAAFRLKQTAPEYAQFAEQFSVPCVLALVKGGGLQPVSGEITETKLMQAYVTASRPAAGCCPDGSTGCCPQ